MDPEKTILVTGAAGFIGSNLVTRLLSEGYQVTILIKSTTNIGRLQKLLPKVKCCYVDLLDFDNLKREMEIIKPLGVFHLAASNIQSGMTAPDEDVVKVNILGIRNLLKALDLVDYNFFINLGSFLEYGPKSEPVNEACPCTPTELYSITKLASTLYGQTVAHNNNKPVVTFRLFTPYGPEIQPGRLVYELITRALRGGDINLTQPNYARDFLFVDDLIDLLLEAKDRARDCQGEVFNAGSGQSVALKAVAEEVLKITESRSKINWGSFRQVAYDSQIWQADMNKTFATFKWRPKYSLSSGLSKTINWFENNKN